MQLKPAWLLHSVGEFEYGSYHLNTKLFGDNYVYIFAIDEFEMSIYLYDSSDRKTVICDKVTRTLTNPLRTIHYKKKAKEDNSL